MASGTLLSIEEFASLPDEPGKQELSEGEVILVPPPHAIHTEICWRFTEALRDYLKRSGKGRVYPEAGFRLGPHTVRQPDIAVLLETPVLPEGDWVSGAPDIAIEVLSPGNSAEDIELKISQYLAAGAKVVWIVSPKARQVSIYRADGSGTLLREPQNLTGESVLPGFTLALVELFA
jgi:Uma2 family endonuclease